MDPRLRSACEIVRTERRRIDDEAAAFRSFIRRIDRVDTPTASGPCATHQGTVMGSSNQQESLSAVRSAYAETVMAVPHFEADYGESFRTHFAAEFSSELFAALSSAPVLSPELKNMVLSGARRCRKERVEFRDRLKREYQSIRHIGREIEAIEDPLDGHVSGESFGGLVALHRYSIDACSVLDELAADRQAEIEQINHGMNTDIPSIQTYLYADPTYPALTAIADRARSITESKRQIEREITAR
ncbi:DUF7260 family protein [Halalkalirubrum salinum]|uniref:DUF7260 family protein n=1 Tax=Halalkalirubrum salinum TaxID=2563889 RepID=UPI0010FB34E5|nr:hypothetical protein [Halalkalirubrum salinum]